MAWCRAAAQMSCRLRYCFGMFFEHCCLGFRVYWVGGCQNSFVSAVFGVLLESGSAVREHVSVDFQPQGFKKGVFSSSDIGAVNAGLRLEIRSPTCYIPPGCNFSESPGCVRSHPCACLFAASESSVVRYTSMKYREDIVAWKAYEEMEQEKQKKGGESGKDDAGTKEQKQQHD